MARARKAQQAPVQMPDVAIEIQTSPNLERRYVDGVAGLSVGPAVVKIDFFRADISQGEGNTIRELRNVELNLAMPTLQFFEFVANSLDGALDNRALLNEGMKQALEKITEAVKRAAEKA